MPLHPEIAKVLAALPHPVGPLDPVAMRAAEEAQVVTAALRLPLHRVEDAVVAGVPVRFYTASATPEGTLVYLHGGAFFLGSLDTHDHVARSLAAETGRTVVSVGYRLAPEHAFPAGLTDCFEVTRALLAEGPVALAGDSSGGTFVAAVAAMVHDAGLAGLTHQVLYYPSLDLDFDESRYPSLVDNAVGYGLETAGLRPFNAFYLSSGADPADPRVSPIKRADLTGLPPALILTGELDPLRDEGERYGERLRTAGVPATVTRYVGAGHGFVQHFGWLPEYHRAFTETAEFLA
jgi:acetyl esterase